jgi:ribosomal-protein-alanine N-acetyltransferase
MIIRPMKKKDLDQVLDIEAVSFLSPWNETQFLYELKDNPFSFLLVAEEGSHIIGFIDFWITFEHATINQIAIIPGLRKKGLGNLLLTDALSRMKVGGSDSVSLEVRTHNAEAVSLYRKHGFVLVSTKKGYYDNGDDAYYMIKDLKI